MTSKNNKILLYMLENEVSTVDKIRNATGIPRSYFGSYLYHLKKNGCLINIEYGTYKITERGIEKATRIKETLDESNNVQVLFTDDKQLIPNIEIQKKQVDKKNKIGVEIQDLKLVSSLNKKYGKNQLIEIIQTLSG